MKAWERLEYYETQDILSRMYYQKHNHDLSNSKSLEIISCLLQGRRYFSSANGADDLVKPLLLYYGVLSLSRALILFKESQLRETSLSQSHGLGIHDWNNNFRSGDDFLNLIVRPSDGTFYQLLRATKNLERNSILRVGQKQSCEIDQQGTIDFSFEEKILIDDIISRVPALSESYERVLERKSMCFHGAIQDECLTIYKSSIQNEDEDWFRQSSGIKDPIDTSSFLEVWRINKKNGPGREDSFGFMAVGARYNTIIPPIQMDNGTLQFSQLMLAYVLSYALGMVCRYYPSKWRGILARNTGSSIYPLLRNTIQHIEDFPSMIVSELEKVPPRGLSNY
jgi:hypothetical protein